MNNEEMNVTNNQEENTEAPVAESVVNESVSQASEATKAEESSTEVCLESINPIKLIDWTYFFREIESAMSNVNKIDNDENYINAKVLLQELMTYSVLRNKELYFINGIPVQDCKFNDQLANLFRVTWRVEFYDRYNGPNFKGDDVVVDLTHDWNDYVRAIATITKRINPKFRVNGGGTMFDNKEESFVVGYSYLNADGAVNLSATEVKLLPWMDPRYDFYEGVNVIDYRMYMTRLGQKFVGIVNALPGGMNQ